MLRKYRFWGKNWGYSFGVKICMNLYGIVMFEFNYSVGDIKNSELGEEIVCLGEGSGGKGEGSGERGEGSGRKGEGSGGKGGGKWGKPTPPPCPPPPISLVNECLLMYHLWQAVLLFIKQNRYLIYYIRYLI